MVRFKNRHLLVEFISPSSLGSSLSKKSVVGANEAISISIPAGPNPDEVDEDEDDLLPVLPSIPFMVPHTDLSGQLRLGEDGASAVFKAVRTNVLDVFGDEGWGRLASSFKGEVASFKLLNWM